MRVPTLTQMYEFLWGKKPEPDPVYAAPVDDYEPDPRCTHENLVVANARVTQEDGMALYVNMLIECPECKDIWRLQHRVNEIAQITGASDRFLSPRELGLEVREEGGKLTKTDHVEETLRILRANNIRLPRKSKGKKNVRRNRKTLDSRRKA